MQIKLDQSILSQCYFILAQKCQCAVIILNKNYSIYDLNPAAEQIFGWQGISCKDRNFFEFCHEYGHSFDKFNEQNSYIQNTCKVGHINLQLSWIINNINIADEFQGYLLITTKPIEEILNSILPFSQQLEADAHVLKQKILFYENLIAAMPCHVYWKDKNGVYLGSNAINAQAAGLKSASEIIGKSDYELAWKHEADKIVVTDKKVIKTGKMVVLEEHVTIANGKNAFFLSHKTPIFDTNNKVTGLVGISFNIEKFTKLKAYLLKKTKQAQFESTETQLYLANLIAAMPGHVYWKNKDGIYLGSNDKNAKIAGLSFGKELIGKTDYDLPWKDQAAQIRETDIAVMESGKPLIREEIGRLASGVQLTVLSHKVPLFDKKRNVFGILGISLDITKLKETELALREAKEKAEIANQAKSDFITNMSHDIRTPFSGILSLTQYMAKQEKDLQKSEYLTMIAETAESLLAFLSEILELTEIESGKQIIKLMPFNMYELVQDIATMIKPAVNDKGLNFSVNYPTNIPHFFISDRLRVHRILLNIVSNALKFTQNGSVNIDVTIHKHKGSNIILKLAVQDTGIGIATDKFDLIFDKFTRINPSYQGNYQGTGLGLNIVKQYLADIDGIIKIKSKLGEGSVFSCYIPMQIV